MPEGELAKLHRRFLQLTDGHDEMTQRQFETIPEIRPNPLRGRLMSVFGFNSTCQSIDFKSFVSVYSKFTLYADKDRKLRGRC